MNARNARHSTFVIERTFDAAPAVVFSAWADPAAKARWFAGTKGKWTQTERTLDFRVGGTERLVGAWTDGPVSVFNARYEDIVPDERIIYTYDMHMGERRISISLATVQFQPAGGGTRMTFTEQDVFLDGYDDAGSREHGTNWLLDKLGDALKTETAGA